MSVKKFGKSFKTAPLNAVWILLLKTLQKNGVNGKFCLDGEKHLGMSHAKKDK